MTNHLSMLKNASVTIRKGDFSITIGKQPLGWETNYIVPVKIAPVIHHPAMTFQDVAFILATIVLVAYITRMIYLKTTKL